MSSASVPEDPTADLRWLRRLAHRLAAQDADDLVQDTWLLCQHHLPQPRGGRGLRGWLAQTMRHRWFAIRRSDIARGQREHRVPPPTAAPVPEQLAIDGDVTRILQDALGTLSDAERELLRGRFFDGRTAAELARDLGVPAATVRSRIHRALGRLRKVLDERHGDRSTWSAAWLSPALTPTTELETGLTMTTTTKCLMLAGTLFGLAAFGWLVLGHEDPGAAPEPSRADAPTVEVIAASKSEAPPPADTNRAAAWQERVTAVHKARSERRASDGDADEAPLLELPPPANLMAQMAEFGCYDRLPDHPRGNLMMRVHYVGEPGVGSVVQSVGVVEDTMNAAELSECWLHSLYMIELDDADAPVEGAFDVGYNAGDGSKVEGLLALVKGFVSEHPELTERYEILARLRDLPDGTPVNRFLSDYMRVLGEDPELQAALAMYIAATSESHSESSQ